jgi:hypothetical protein
MKRKLTVSIAIALLFIIGTKSMAVASEASTDTIRLSIALNRDDCKGDKNDDCGGRTGGSGSLTQGSQSGL